eukprot:scaffold93708_cov72-Phaeocystis_antarctica.AAC.8
MRPAASCPSATAIAAPGPGGTGRGYIRAASNPRSPCGSASPPAAAGKTSRPNTREPPLRTAAGMVRSFDRPVPSCSEAQGARTCRVAAQLCTRRSNSCAVSARRRDCPGTRPRRGSFFRVAWPTGARWRGHRAGSPPQAGPNGTWAVTRKESGSPHMRCVGPIQSRGAGTSRAGDLSDRARKLARSLLPLRCAQT